MAGQPLGASKSFFHGALILSAAALFIKVLSAAYRIPYQNIAGDIGFYIFQQVYPFYGIAIALSTLGFPVVISKLIAESQSSEHVFSAKEIVQTSFAVIGLIGVSIFIGLYFGSDWIADSMKDHKLAGLLKMTAFYFLLMPFLSVFRGFYQGRHDMIPTAVSQVLEQIIRVAGILILSFILIHQGKSLYAAGTGAVFASILGGFVSLLILAGFVFFRSDWADFHGGRAAKGYFLKIAKALLFEGFSFCLTSLILVLIQLVDSLHLYSLLKESGMGQMEAKEWKGVYDRGQPLIQLGTVISNSISLSMVPLISRCVKMGNKKELYNKVNLSLRSAVTIGAAASAGLIFIIKPANYMLFTDTRGTAALGILACSILFTSLIMAEASVLQSLGRTRATVWIVFAGIAFKWLFNLLLVKVYGITGAALASVAAFAFMSLLFYAVLKLELKRTLLEKRHLFIVLTGLAVMAASLMAVNGLFHLFFRGLQVSRVLAACQALAGAGIGGAVFIAYILRAKLFNREELGILPMGDKLAKVMQDQHEN
ncbi:putative polysaccharide biosynthesis protein [Peribacillus sp. B-H-3]|uniref:putative polysaccharide biosynthesis protein n=1 Tax=Peribacillus sp. B-H-3 TaxID=3400420 RepID=UPI003B028125